MSQNLIFDNNNTKNTLKTSQNIIFDNNSRFLDVNIVSILEGFCPLEYLVGGMQKYKYTNTNTQIHKYKSVIVVHCGLVGARHARKRRILSEEGRNTSSSGNSFSSNNKLCRCLFNSSQILKGLENLDILRPRGQCPSNIVQLYNRYTDTHKSLVCLLYFSGGNSLLAKQ